MKLIVGLGNPGVRYQNTRHNVGFMVLDALAKQQGTLFKASGNAHVAQCFLGNEKVILCKPQTFMNLSGDAVLPLMQFYKLQPEELLVVQDDLDSAFGTLKLRGNGRSGGQKGVEDILKRLNATHFARLKLGIDRPPSGWQVADWVLSQFNTTEKSILDELILTSTKACAVWAQVGLLAAQQQFNATDFRQEDTSLEHQDVRHDQP